MGAFVNHGILSEKPMEYSKEDQAGIPTHSRGARAFVNHEMLPFSTRLLGAGTLLHFHCSANHETISMKGTISLVSSTRGLAIHKLETTRLLVIISMARGVFVTISGAKRP
jgi:hypothetical protein